MKKNRNKKFLTDIIIYGIGNLGSKLITFLLIPLYTYFVNPSDFGYYDLTMNMIFLIMPVLTFQLKDGAFRLLLDNKSETLRKGIITFTYKFIAISSSIAILFVGIISFFYAIQYVGWCISLMIVMSFYEIVIQIVRGINKNKYFVAAGILTALLIGILSIIFVVILKMGISGIFFANILARILVLLFLELRLHIYKKYFVYKFNDKQINRTLINYSFPLLPNVLCWWLICGSNRLFVLHFLGLEANGIYAVSMKLSTILETFTVIIYQAWQETAIKQYTSEDRDSFFSRIFNVYLAILSIISIGFSFLLKINYSWLVEKHYQSSLQYIYLMTISVIFYGLASFLDLGYLCSKQTTKVIPGVIMASLINLGLNYILVQYLGIYGIVYSSIITFVFLFIYRIFDTRKYFKIEFTNIALLSIIILIVSGGVYYYIDSVLLQCVYLIAIATIFWIILPKKIKKQIIDQTRNKILKFHLSNNF
jgi:O-antigen/teichoic acid export membrane protein